MLTISNIKWKYKSVEDPKQLFNIIINRLKLLNIKTSATVATDKSIIFADVVDGKTFVSAVDNVIKIAENDPRIKKNGRDYLLSHRPTKEQYYGFFELINAIMDNLGLLCDIELYIKKNDRRYVIRSGSESLMKNIPEQNSYPVAKEKGETNGKKVQA